eukprot:TRINITY_DN820_c0_g5_i4.p1 TRINITY_DN820_c0_g5~~TRINITY_DN820_c0_g5_i4.p1  ORF type:complete len:136 (+),score=67.18 TRINITY_DN820_c0_g5_i4:25-408(+)
MLRRPPRSTHCISSAASDVYKRQMKRCADEVRQKKMGKNVGYSVMGAPMNPPLSSAYIPKPRAEMTAIAARPEYTPVTQVGSVKREVTQVAADTKSFMDDEDEEVSVAFNELMTEIAKYEGADAKPN